MLCGRRRGTIVAWPIMLPSTYLLGSLQATLQSVWHHHHKVEEDMVRPPQPPVRLSSLLGCRWMLKNTPYGISRACKSIPLVNGRLGSRLPGEIWRRLKTSVDRGVSKPHAPTSRRLHRPGAHRPRALSPPPPPPPIMEIGEMGKLGTEEWALPHPPHSLYEGSPRPFHASRSQSFRLCSRICPSSPRQLHQLPRKLNRKG